MCARSLDWLCNASHSFLVGGVSNAVSVLLIAILAMGMKAIVFVGIVSIVGFIGGRVGGLIAFAVLMRVRNMYPVRIAMQK